MSYRHNPYTYVLAEGVKFLHKGYGFHEQGLKAINGGVIQVAHAQGGLVLQLPELVFRGVGTEVEVARGVQKDHIKRGVKGEQGWLEGGGGKRERSGKREGRGKGRGGGRGERERVEEGHGRRERRGEKGGGRQYSTLLEVKCTCVSDNETYSKHNTRVGSGFAREMPWEVQSVVAGDKTELLISTAKNQVDVTHYKCQ